MTPHGALLSMRSSAIRNHLFNLKKDSATKVFVVLFGLTNVVAIGLVVSYKCFDFAEDFIFGAHLNSQLVSLLFFTLLCLVALSTTIISYTTLFLARETEFLFQHPAPPRTILWLKVIEGVSFSAWASLFLCYPVLIAFGIVKDAPVAYYLEALVLLSLFLGLAGLLGTSISLVLAPLIRRLRGRQLLVLSLAIVAVAGWLFLRSFEFWSLDGENNLLILERFMSGLRAMRSAWSPSRWVSGAILASASGNRPEVLFHGALLLANTLIFLPLLSLYGNRWYGREWIARRSALPTGKPKKQREVQPGLYRHPLGSLVLKDVLVFVRNPAQVSQSVLFLLLMVIYSLSLLHIPEYVTNQRIRIFIHFANVGAVCMILSSFTSRFLFPQLSLEGRAFWILGLAPMSRWLLLRQKVILGLVISLGLGLLTIIASNLALETPPDLFVSAVYTMMLAGTSLTCLATGLGAAYPSFEEDNPARIAAGLGGTLNFFASALAVAAIVSIEALPHILFSAATVPPWAIASAHALALAFALSVSTTALAIGGRALARSEF